MWKYNSKRDEYEEISSSEYSSDDEDQFSFSNNNIHTTPTPERNVEEIVLKERKLGRIVKKSGKLNLFKVKMSNKHISYLKDWGYTLIHIRWRFILMTLFLVNIACFVLFSFLWMILASASGDYNEASKELCLVNTHSFTGYMMLSIETVMTIGYGSRYPTEHCKKGWIVLMLQVLFSVAMQGVLVTTIYVKIAKPFTKMSHSVFSRNAVICKRNDQLCFVFRINDFSRKIWCGTNLFLYFIDKEQSDNSFSLKKMHIQPYGILIFPLEIEHVIDENSPLYEFGPEDIQQKKFEIVAVVEGSSTVTGQISQNRSSYQNSDILWGRRFSPCVDYSDLEETYIVNYKKFKTTIPFDTPRLSAKQLEMDKASTSILTEPQP